MVNDNVSVVIITRNREEDLSECLTSIFSQTIKPHDVVVVDNASSFDVAKKFSKNFPKVKFIRSEVNLGGAGGRNLGLLHSKGKYILFMDDDAVGDKSLIKELVKVIKGDSKIGIVQPKIYEKESPDVIQGVGHGINLQTGRVYGIGVHEKDTGQYEKNMEIPLAGCTWMVRREVFNQIGNYDEEIFIPYEDSDFSQRARENGFKIFYVPKAIVWHTGAKKTFVHPWLQWIGITTPERSYRVSRNKIIFMKKHASKADFLIFIFIYIPIYTLLHSLIILASGRLDILINYWKGLFSGIDYCLLSAKHLVLSLIDPVTWIIDKKAKSILDVACGRGMPMMVLKKRINFKKIVGVDLFEPYLNECKQKNVHDEYYLMDARKLTFENKSFDVVMALQVLEHLRKEEALKVIQKLEKIAKKQVIVATPVGETYHPAVDNNELQLHKSGFTPEEFESLGYKVIKMGRRSIQDEHEGFVGKIKNGFIKKIFYVILLFINPIFYVFQPLADYYMVAYKQI